MVINLRYLFLTVNYKSVAAFILILLVALTSKTSFALAPPPPGAIEQYRQDGTLATRLKRAKQLGNDHFSPELVYKMRQLQTVARGQPLPKSALPSNWRGGLPATGHPKTVAILVDFPDCPNSGGTYLCPDAVLSTPMDVEAQMFGNGIGEEAPYESLRNYYQRSSYGKLTIQGEVLGWYHALHNRIYYEYLEQQFGIGVGNEALIMEAMNYYAAKGHDFAQYDNDGDGTIDAVYLKWAGQRSMDWVGFWWPYQHGWDSQGRNASYTVSGKHVDKYVWSPVTPRYIYAYDPLIDIHETGHLLGLPDYYDYDGSIGPNGGLGGLDMMDSNWGDHNAFSKALLGWLTPTVISGGKQISTLHPTGIAPDAVMIASGATENLLDDFFVAQYRKRDVGNDPIDYPTDGLVIWHVNATLNADGSDFLNNNSYTDHKLLRLMEADGLEEIEQKGLADSGDFYVFPKTLTPSTLPNSNYYDPLSSDYAATFPSSIYIKDISVGGGETMSATFSVISPSYPFTVIYDGNGSTGGSVPVDSTSYEKGTKVTVLGNTGNLVKTGFKFSEWNMAADGSGVAYGAGMSFVMNKESVRLYAQWVRVPQLISGVAIDNETLVGNSAWQHYYAIEVPLGSTQLTFTTTHVNANVDASYFIFTGTEYWNLGFLCSGLGSDDRVCSIDNPTAGTWWLVIAVLENAGTISYSITGTVKTGGAIVTTNTATNITTTGATLNSTVHDNGSETTVTFQYGPTKNYGFSVLAIPNTISAGSGRVVVSAALTGLACVLPIITESWR